MICIVRLIPYDSFRAKYYIDSIPLLPFLSLALTHTLSLSLSLSLFSLFLSLPIESSLSPDRKTRLIKVVTKPIIVTMLFGHSRTSIEFLFFSLSSSLSLIVRPLSPPYTSVFDDLSDRPQQSRS